MSKKLSDQSLRIAPQTHKPTLSKAQQAFNNLIAKIEARRALLVQWQAVVQLCQQKVASDYAPISQEFTQRQADMVRLLDQAMDQKGLTKVERLAVQGLICSMAERLVADTGDETLKAIYNKYSDDDFDTEAAAELEGMKQSMGEMFGVDLGDTSDVTSPEELLARIQAQVLQEEMQAEAAPPPKRKKTAKQLAREAEKKAEDDQTSLSIREVYRKLVSALHPDREPDLEERARKTALMQRVNQAYDKKDLLQLLELQLELEHIDAHSIAGMPEDRLKHFNKILKEQLAELEQEIEYVEMPLRAQFDQYSFQTLTPDQVIPQLNRDIAKLKHHVSVITQELLMLQDLPALKAWIKAYRREIKAMQREQDDDFYF